MCWVRGLNSDRHNCFSKSTVNPCSHFQGCDVSADMLLLRVACTNEPQRQLEKTYCVPVLPVCDCYADLFPHIFEGGILIYILKMMKKLGSERSCQLRRVTELFSVG